MQEFPFPVLSAPGVLAEADGPSYLPMPRSMGTFAAPLLPEPEEVRGLDAARRLLARVLDGARAWQPGQAARFDVLTVPPADRRLIDQVLGEGEVSARVEGVCGLSTTIQESVLAGIWRVREWDADERCRADRIEVCDLPECVAAAGRSGREGPGHLPAVGPGVVNAPGVLTEILAAMGDSSTPSYSINLSLLPFGPEDWAWLEGCLGRGRASILSRGYGNCRIDATGLRRVWRVRFYNSQEVEILSSVEISDCPAVARAAAEDIADSSLRLADILDWLA